jgi:hypothetical protein
MEGVVMAGMIAQSVWQASALGLGSGSATQPRLAACARLYMMRVVAA